MTERDHHEYQQGPWTAVAGGGFLALVEPDASRRVVDGLWDVARDGGDVLAALGVVAADGFAALPRFAVVRADADGVVHAVLRGPVRLRLHGGADAQDVVAGDGAVWTPRSFAADVRGAQDGRPRPPNSARDDRPRRPGTAPAAARRRTARAPRERHGRPPLRRTGGGRSVARRGT